LAQKTRHHRLTPVSDVNTGNMGAVVTDNLQVTYAAVVDPFRRNSSKLGCAEIVGVLRVGLNLTANFKYFEMSVVSVVLVVELVGSFGFASYGLQQVFEVETPPSF